MENNIKKAIEQIDVPMDKLDAALVQGVNQKVKKQRRPLLKIALGLVATLVIVLISGYFSSGIARVLATVPILGNLYYTIEEQDKGLQIALSDANKVVLNESVTSAGITVTFEEIVYDGERLHVIFSMDEYREIYPLNVFVDGYRVNQAESSRELESDTGYRGLWEIDIEEELPDAFLLTIQIRHMRGIEGDWQVTTPIEKVNNHERMIAVHQKGKIDGIDYEVDELKISDTGTVLKVRFFEDALKIAVSDDRIAATITDQQGVPLNVVDFDKIAEEKALVYQYRLEPLAPDVKSLALQFYIEPNFAELKEINKLLTHKQPQRISFGKIGKLVVTDVVEQGDLRTLRFKVESDFAFDYSFSPNNIDVRNHAGESLKTDFVHAVGPNEYELTYQDVGGDVYVHLLKMPKLKVLERFELAVE